MRNTSSRSHRENRWHINDANIRKAAADRGAERRTADVIITAVDHDIVIDCAAHVHRRLVPIVVAASLGIDIVDAAHAPPHHHRRHPPHHIIAVNTVVRGTHTVEGRPRQRRPRRRMTVDIGRASIARAIDVNTIERNGRTPVPANSARPSRKRAPIRTIAAKVAPIIIDLRQPPPFRRRPRPLPTPQRNRLKQRFPFQAIILLRHPLSSK